jgi:hypothetical protein
MLETPRIRRYSPRHTPSWRVGSAVKIRPVRTISRKGSALRGAENPQRPYAELPHTRDEDMVHAPWRHGDHVNYNGEFPNWPLENPAICWNTRVSGGTRACRTRVVRSSACAVRIRPVRTISRKPEGSTLNSMPGEYAASWTVRDASASRSTATRTLAQSGDGNCIPFSMCINMSRIEQSSKR